MTMTDDQGSPVKPQSETLYLLGGLNAKMDAVLSAQGGYDSRLRNVEDGLATLKAREAPRTPWYSALNGVAALLAVLGSIVTVTLFIVNR